MTLLGQFLALLAIHWFADFVLQTHWQASNKSKNWNALTRHVTVYTVALGIGCTPLFGFENAGLFAVINGLLHFGTDAATSRITSRLYAAGDYHNFFVVIGFDQLIHQMTLAVMLVLLFG